MMKLLVACLFVVVLTVGAYGQRREVASVNPAETRESISRVEREAAVTESKAREDRALARERQARDQAREAARASERAEGRDDVYADKAHRNAADKAQNVREAIREREAATRDYERARQDRDRGGSRDWW